MAHSLDFKAAAAHLDAMFRAIAEGTAPGSDSAAGPDRMAGSDARAQAAITKWIELMLDWNARMDLTAARTEAELCDLMLADAIALAPRLPRDARVVDVGSGAGAPGLPIALLRPDLRVTLVEPLAKRVAFLRTVIGTVGRADVVLERGRGENVRGTFDVAISRATLAPAAWLALGASLVAPGGSVWVLLAKEEPPAHAGTTLAETIAYTWPGTQASRRAVRYTRDA